MNEARAGLIRSAYTAWCVLQAFGYKKTFQKYCESQGLIPKPKDTLTDEERAAKAAERQAEIDRAHERANRVISLDQKRKQKRQA